MTSLPTKLFSVFSDGLNGGNLAAVVENDCGLETAEMHEIASHLLVPTTGFVTPLAPDKFAVRFFSPCEEMDMCGHVAMAVSEHLFANRPDTCRIIDLVTDGGHLRAARQFDNSTATTALQVKRPKCQETSIDTTALSAAFYGRLAPTSGVLATGMLKHLLIEVGERFGLSTLEWRNERIKAFCNQFGIDTIGIWARDQRGVFLRDLCHGVGNDEEAASGTTCSALASWLLRENDSIGTELSIYQGQDMGRPSRITIRANSTTADELLILGKIDCYLQGKFELANHS